MDDLNSKIDQVKTRLRALGKAAVAFSGGKDSFFLMKTAVETLGKENVVALNVRSNFSSKNDARRVEYFCRLLDFNLRQLEIDIASEEKVMSNPKDRCYFCKKKIFTALKSEAKQLGIENVLDGTTFSDLNEYRPGMKAIEELGVISPLLEAGITSAEIISLLRETLQVEEYYLTSSACLATRFPYDFHLDEKTLRRFDEIETYLVGQGIFPVKVRYIPDGIRIETPAKNFPRILEDREKILKFCREQDLKFVTLDIEGIKSGVWD
ncbi:MAG: pyridinium-3,5-biscarboxylic acid mononucleotide sulfurtransferase [Acidobacteriota bacterium]|nr:pyridinium-3,5-biscarboxylic acid mononucleotide sulfurtransferase [Acidobacteriota bacterium]